MNINTIYNENCLDTMARMPDGFIDLAVTSPPYDNLRKYNGYSFDFEAIAKELFRVVKVGGVVVWVVADATVNGSESGTSFRQALHFMSLGFNLHDTMIYEKSGMAYPDSTRYNQIFEYMFVFSKGDVKSVNLIKDRPNKFVGTMGGNKRGGLCRRGKFGARFNIWRYANGRDNSSEDRIAFDHPAIFPESLAKDHILSWSNEGDLVYDCFGGSGTVAKMAHLEKRNWILSEISSEYAVLAAKRIDPYLRQMTLF
jgi:DNA modification methylase